MQSQHPQLPELEEIVAAYRERLEAAIACLPRGFEREYLRREIRQTDAASPGHAWPHSEH
jgi:hypothetical protein